MALIQRRASSKFARDRQGVAAIEMAIIGPILCFMLTGLFDFGMLYFKRLEISNAARAGVEYAVANGWNQTAIVTEVTSATSLGTVSATPAPSNTCGCPNATTGIATATCGSGCSGGGTAGTYVQVSATDTYTSILTYPGVANPMTLTAVAIARIN